MDPPRRRPNQPRPAVYESAAVGTLEGRETVPTNVYVDIYDVYPRRPSSGHSKVRIGPSAPPVSDLAGCGRGVVKPSHSERSLATGNAWKYGNP